MLLDTLYVKFLSESTKRKAESIVVRIAIMSFIVHLVLIGLLDIGLLKIAHTSELLKNPISAIYTPFSFVLIYEVYLLIYYLPKSINKYIGMQYEIITLIIIRRIFKDLYKLEYSPNWFASKYNIQFAYDIVGTIVLFYLILVFYRLNPKKVKQQGAQTPQPSLEMLQFVKMKKNIATCLIPTFFCLALYNVTKWAYENIFLVHEIVETIDVNKIFFDGFFTVLILIDVFLLLISFLNTDEFSKVIRNSGFIISTILIKLSFGISGLLNIILTIVAVLIGVLFLAIHNQYQKLGEI